MLFVTCHLRVAATVCDGVGVVSQGRLVKLVPTREVRVPRRHAHRQALLAAAPGLKSPQTAIDATP